LNLASTTDNITVTDSVARQNVGDGFKVAGIDNTIKGCAATGNTGIGFDHLGGSGEGSALADMDNLFFNNYARRNQQNYHNIATDVCAKEVGRQTGFWANLDLAR